VLARSFSQPSIELELLPVYQPKTGQLRMLGVNKSLRSYTAKLGVSCLLVNCKNMDGGTVSILSKSLVSVRSNFDGEIVNSQRVYTLNVPPESVFIVDFINNDSPLPPEFSLSNVK